MPSLPPLQVTLIGKPGCHLCDTARDVVGQVVDEVGTDSSARQVVVSEVSILDDAELFDRYSEEIPVVLIDGRVHTIYRVDPARLRTALARA